MFVNVICVTVGCQLIVSPSQLSYLYREKAGVERPVVVVPRGHVVSAQWSQVVPNIPGTRADTAVYTRADANPLLIF